MEKDGANTPATKRPRTNSNINKTPSAPTPSQYAAGGSSKAKTTTPPSSNKSARSRSASASNILQGYTILVLPNVGIKHLPAKIKIWIPAVQRLGGKIIQSYPPETQKKEESSAKNNISKTANQEKEKETTQHEILHNITHILVGPGGLNSLPPFLREHSHPGTSDSDEDLAARDHSPFIVDHTWLEQTLLAGVPQAEGQHRPKTATQQQQKTSVSVVVPGGNRDSSYSDKEESKQTYQHMRRRHLPSASEVESRRLWLGSAWHDDCAIMTLNELVLQNIYNIERSIQLRNEPIALTLAEMGNYERALNEDYFEHPDKGGEETINHRALRYFRAAAVVRGCAYSLKQRYFSIHSRNADSEETPSRKIYWGSEEREAFVREDDDEEQEEEEDDDIPNLPFVGEATKKQIHAIIETGTCETLECFRNDLQVADSRGKLRHDTLGAATRYAFFKLPGVGQKTARLWWDLGFRSYEDVIEASQEGEALSPGSPNKLTIDQKFSLENRHDLLEDTTDEEVENMLTMVKHALKEVSHPTGWRVELVGGGRRSSASHDADFLVTHPSLPTENVVLALKDYLIAQGQLFPPSEAMCRIQNGLLPNHIQKLKEEHKKEASAAPGYQTLDRFDHIYGNTRVPATGRVKRIDIIICPANEWAFAFLGWVGSRTFLRMQRNFAKDLGMFLNSHALFLKQQHNGEDSFVVPNERPPRLRDGRSGWPPGWNAERKVQTEEDVFELLGTPYRVPSQRNCF